ncbi:hypothetical protein KKF34_14555 [Myxococcota bacterium]|nr:hypothetical protein [Myxococcota bacterium]MBU1382092.1 hypothetical protein [Myxococcota bacterium]MBU1498095.1 hypothetical protein [Myxococcota bacterium]
MELEPENPKRGDGMVGLTKLEMFFRNKNSKLPEKVTIKLCVPKDYRNTVEGKYNYQVTVL